MKMSSKKSLTDLIYKLTTLLVVSLFCFKANASGYYHKGEFVVLTQATVLLEDLMQYSKADGGTVIITNKIILKPLTNLQPSYFENKYGLILSRQYNQTLVFEAEHIEDVLSICQRIFETEAVKYVHPSFVRGIQKHGIRHFSGLSNKRLVSKYINPHANENVKDMLDVDNSVNYWKYFDDVFRYHDESFWHIHNKGGFVTQAFYLDEAYAVESLADVDTNVLEVLDQGYSGKGVRVAVVDSSFAMNHPDLRFSDSLNLHTLNRDVSPSSSADFHGTAVAGVLAANKGNNYGIMGVAPDAYIIAINGLFDIESDEVFSQSYLDIFSRALELDIDVLNCSWSTTSSLDEASEDAINTFVREARDGKGGFVVFSAGNDSSTELTYESALNSVISVGAIEADGTRSKYSDYGKYLDLVAPTNFVSLDLLGDKGFDQHEMGFIAGTSFSAPIVSGVIALMLEANPELTGDEVKQILYSTTKRIGSDDFELASVSYEYAYEVDENDKFNQFYPKSREVGFGLVDAHAAVQKALLFNQQAELPTQDPLISIMENMKPGWNFLGSSKAIVDFQIFDQVSIVWCFVDNVWKGYSANIEYVQSLRQQDKLLLEIPANSGFWVFKDEIF